LLPRIFLKMHLAEAYAPLFFAVVPAFVDALPVSPKHNEPGATNSGQRQSEERNRASRDNAITFLRFEIQELPRALTKDYAVYDLSDDAFRTASDALEDILLLLHELVDDAIPRYESNVSVGKPLLITAIASRFYAGRALPRYCDTAVSPVPKLKFFS
jgi:hypothetical protein